MRHATSLPERRRYRDRHEAGKLLATELGDLIGCHDAVVLGLPPGGVPVAAAIAQTLGLPLDIFVVRRVGLPGDPAITIGGLASGGIRVVDRELIVAAGVPWAHVDESMRAEQMALTRCESGFRRGRRPLALTHRRVILVDDGLAVSATMRVAVQAVRAFKPREILVAVPVASVSARDDVCAVADRIVCPLVSATCCDVSDWYDEFDEISDAEVRGLLGLPDVRAVTAI